jgi:hypothetical protein
MRHPIRLVTLAALLCGIEMSGCGLKSIEAARC